MKEDVRRQTDAGSNSLENWREKCAVATQASAEIWRISLTTEAAHAVQSHLSDGERTRAERFVQPEHRARFVAARGSLRCILAGYLSTKPGKIVIDQNPGCKPRLGGVYSSSDLRFNVSKSGGVAYVAVSRGWEIGIDIETQRPELFEGAAAAEILSPIEMSAYRNLPPHERSAFVCRTFTRKEAVLKVCGEGLAVPMTEFEVDRTRMVCSVAHKRSGGSEQAGIYRVCDLDLGKGCYGAVAANGPVATIRYRDWPESSYHCVERSWRDFGIEFSKSNNDRHDRI